ncbi:MAG: choice-of-anchor Q domain-containing protein, partial [Rubripirellula sp.]
AGGTGGGLLTLDDPSGSPGAPISATTLINTIVAGNIQGIESNATPSDIAGKSLEAESVYNLVGDPATAGGLVEGDDAGNLVGDGAGNPLAPNLIFGPLADNGGPTSTHALVPGSRAINAGDPAALTPPLENDQRGAGFSRVIGQRTDIGAFEVQSPSLVSFARESPINANTSADTLIFRATFDEQVLNVDATDFVVGGGTTAMITNVAAVQGTGETQYLITVSGGDLVDFNGVVGLDLSATQDITDVALNSLLSEEPTVDETFAVDNADDIAPRVERLEIDGGTGQRSVVRSITVTFNEQVSVDDDAFTLHTKSGVAVAVTPVISMIDGKTQVVLSFGGSQVDASGSLIDGNYRLTMLDTHIRDAAGNAFDGSASGGAGGPRVDDFFRLYGDVDGDRDVDRRDYVFFRRTYRRTPGDLYFNPALDHEGDGDVDRDDLDLFRLNYRKRLSP